MRPQSGRLLGLALLWLPAAAGAHSFGRLYNLPVPLWLYLYGAAAALLASFLVIAWFGSRAAGPAPAVSAIDAGDASPLDRLPRPLLRLAQAGSVGLLLLAVVSGLWGSQNAYANFNMSGFWIGFVLGFAYLVALCGNLYARLNPWLLLVRALERWRGPFEGRLAAPAWLGVLPALALYTAFIWLELFGRLSPRGLSLALIAYSLINLVAAWLVGTVCWFRQGEFFAVFLGWLARCAPLDGSGPALRWRWPFAGLLQARVTHYSALVFVLFMLSSTAFDGLRETVPWVRLYWQQLYALWWSPLFGTNTAEAYPQILRLYAVWQTAGLLLSPLLYLGVYLACLQMARWLTGTTLGLRTLALRFAPTLVPIALVYHLTHYYTLLFTQGAVLPWLLSDPFGSGNEWAWRFLGSPRLVIPDAGVVWHTQVALILLGHIVSVVLAHRVALELFGSRRQATLSQLPMLLLMMLYTGSGLWILAQPLNAANY